MKRLIPLVLLFLLSTVTSSATPARRQTSATPQSHVEWVMQSLSRMESIKPGMTRGDLEKVFTPDGGLQTGAVYVLRECQYFKVKVEFVSTRRPGERPKSPELEFLPGDVIKSISVPYIQRMIID